MPAEHTGWEGRIVLIGTTSAVRAATSRSATVPSHLSRFGLTIRLSSKVVFSPGEVRVAVEEEFGLELFPRHGRRGRGTPQIRRSSSPAMMRCSS